MKLILALLRNPQTPLVLLVAQAPWTECMLPYYNHLEHLKLEKKDLVFVKSITKFVTANKQIQ